MLRKGQNLGCRQSKGNTAIVDAPASCLLLWLFIGAPWGRTWGTRLGQQVLFTCGSIPLTADSFILNRSLPESPIFILQGIPALCSCSC